MRTDPSQDFDPAALGGLTVGPDAVPHENFQRAVTNPRAIGGFADIWAGPQTDSRWLPNFLHNRQDELGLVNIAAGSSESESKVSMINLGRTVQCILNEG